MRFKCKPIWLSCINFRPLCFNFKMSSEILKIEEIKCKSVQNGLVLFLHGSGDTGHGAKAWVEMLLGAKSAFPHLNIIFPTAPVRPYTPLGGDLSHVWFNRKSIRPDVPEDLDTLEPMAKEISKLIEKHVANGIPISRIVLGGFSMGGAMALHVAYRYKPELAGVFTLSSFINSDSILYKDLMSKQAKGDNKPQLPPLFMCHGERDDLVKIEWGEETFKKLTSLGVTAGFHRFPNMLHELKKKELEVLYNWINNRVKDETV